MNVEVLSLISVSVPTESVTGGAAVFNRIRHTVRALKRDKAVSHAQAWFYLKGGSYGDIPFLRRRDFLRVWALPKPPREQLACCLGMRQGFRGGEVAHAQLRHVDVDDGVLYVDDTKDQRLYPLPLDRDTAYAYTRLTDTDACPYVLRRHPRFTKWQGPVTERHYMSLVKRWARDAGVQDWPTWHPTLLRAFFAKEWARRGGDIVLLSKVMRHHSPWTTWLYLQKFVYVEDLRREMEHLCTPQPQPDQEE